MTVIAAAGDAFAAALADALQAQGCSDRVRHTVLVCLPRAGPVESLLLAGARAVTADGATRLLLVHEARAAAGFARALFLEEKVTTVVLDVPREHPQAIAWICAEAAAAQGCREVRYDADGTRREPSLRVLDLQPAANVPALGPGDVLVVTGGGKGIAAECAFDLGQRTGARLALLGRATPETDRELAANLARMHAAGVACDYFIADVTDPAAVAAAVAAITARCGVPTAVLHGAGRNEPVRVRDLDAVAFRATCAPKVDGLHHLLAHCDPARLRLVVAFGSVIARTGLHGEADYAHANEEMRRALTAWQTAHAHCRVLTLEWSVWSGTGMGERLGRIDALLREGITPIPIDAGVRVLRELLATPHLPPSVVVTGRLGDLPTAKWADRELPLLRYLERVGAHTPRVELVTDTELSHGRDPYLADHQLDHDALFPAVLGLEAMAQAHRALGGEPDAPHGLGFTDVEFARPIVVPEADPLALRVAALRHNDGAVEVALRCATTSFAADHFRARVQTLPTRAPWAASVAAAGDIDLVPAQDLYGEVCFQGPRFQRVRRYLTLTARSCRVELAAAPASWFQSVLPSDLLLGDPGVRDAALHAISACIPHRRLLPLRVARISGGLLTGPGPFVAQAIERRHAGDIFEYDLSLTDADGREVERWEALQFKAVAARTLRSWHPALLVTYLERRVEEVTGVRLGSVRLGTKTRDLASVTHRLDGKPEHGFGPAADGDHLARAHAAGLEFTVTAPCQVGCDLEPVAPRPLAHWRDLLAPAQLDLAHLLARECNEPIDRSATRVWNVIECAKKAGLPEPFLPTFAQAWPDGCVLLRAGDVRIASVVPTVKGVPNPLALAVLVSQHAAT
jgi:enediyne polyketide synthase